MKHICKRYPDCFLRNSKIYIGIIRPPNELKYILCDFSWKNIKTEFILKLYSMLTEMLVENAGIITLAS